MNNLNQHLYSLGVKSIYFCSGSRNYSLKEEFKSFHMTYHFDERVASFMALGEAKQSGLPVVICTTSGTAVAECLPAMIEAYYSNVKLIMVSADRPDRLRHTHAPQAINQLNIFSDYTRSKFNGTLKDYRADNIHYPFHINLEIDDTKIKLVQNSVREIDKDELSEKVNELSSPLIIFSEDDEDNSRYFDHFNELGFNIYKECTANITATAKCNIKYDHTLIEMLKDGLIDGVIKFGRTPISKIWRLLDNSFSHIPVFCIGQEKTGLSSGFIYLDKESILTLSLNKRQSVKPLETSILDFKKDYPESEFTVFDNILDSINAKSILFLGNSMSIRYGQLLYRKEFSYVAMRGANGIDGQISTAIGYAKNSSKDVHLIIGDLTFLYDLNALVVQWPENLHVHVLNNNGGRIFERINLSGDVINEHYIDLEKIVKGFGVDQVSIYHINNQQTQKYWELIP